MQSYSKSTTEREKKNEWVREENSKAERVKVAALKDELLSLKAENLKLRATIEFSSPRPKRFNVSAP